MPAPSGKDGAPTAKPLVPKESLWDFEGRGRRLTVIGARDFACNVAARPTSARRELRGDRRSLPEALGLRRPNGLRAHLAPSAALLAVALDLARELLLAQVDRVAKVARAIVRAKGHSLEGEGDLGHLVV